MTPLVGIHDVSLKQKLLRRLLRDCVPDVKHSFDNPSELSYVVSTVKTYKLLSESAPESLEKDLVEEWKEAINSWVNRLLLLVSSPLPDKCWAGLCLLGVTCQECSSERFLASYPEWLNKLLHHVQLQTVSHFVRAASCASLSDLFTRLSEFSNAKDVIPQATRIIQPALKLLNEDTSSVVLKFEHSYAVGRVFSQLVCRTILTFLLAKGLKVLEEDIKWNIGPYCSPVTGKNLCLLCTVINFFPKSVKPHFDNVETAIVLKLMSGKCSDNVLKKLGYVLSLLPKTKGDEGSWSLMMEKIMLSINSQLNDALQGLEEESMISETKRVLLPPGKEPPPPLGGLSQSEQSLDFSSRRPERLLGSRISALMDCCSNMLTNSYPALVSVPVRGLVALAGRVLMVDGSPLLSSYPFMTILKQELIRSELPLMQLYSLEILTAVVFRLSSQLLPHAAHIAKLLTEFLRRCTFLDLRTKAYSVLKSLLLSMGVGMAIHMNQEVVDCVIMDLTTLGGERDGKSSDSRIEAHSDLLSKSTRKKRKRSDVTGSFQKDPASDGVLVHIPHNSTEVLVKVAALEALEALLSVGGSMKSDSWRANVDHLLITLATDACQMGLSNDERKGFLFDEPSASWADFQLATLRALLASLISPGRLRPPHLGLGLELFRRGIQVTGTKLAEYCGHALLALEVLIHPRAVPLSDFESNLNEYKVASRSFTDTSGLRQPSMFQTWTGPHELESDDDELIKNWHRNDDDKSETQVANVPENATPIEKLVPTVSYSSPKELPTVAGTSVIHVPEASEHKSSASHLSAAGDSDKGEPMAESPRTDKTELMVQPINHDKDKLMVESPHLRNAGGQRADVAPTTDGPVALSGRIDSGSGELDPMGGKKASMKNIAIQSEMTSTPHQEASHSEQVTDTTDDRYSKVVERLSATLENMKRNKEQMCGLDSDSEDPLPDIVFEDSSSDD